MEVAKLFNSRPTPSKSSMEAVLKRLLGKAKNKISSVTVLTDAVIDTDVKVELEHNASEEVNLGTSLLNGVEDITSVADEKAEIETSVIVEFPGSELQSSSADGVELETNSSCKVRTSLTDEIKRESNTPAGIDVINSRTGICLKQIVYSLSELLVGDNGLAKDEEKSPELKIDTYAKAIKSRSSRRKPEKTRRVFEEDQDDEIGAYYEYIDEDLDEKKETHPSSPRRDEEMMIICNDDNSDELYEDLVLPEGTIFVRPEPPNSSPPPAECESSRLKKMFKGNLDYAIIHCTACNKQIGVDGNMDIHRHPILKVLVCKKCFALNQDIEIEQDDEGSDEQCRWCGQRGELICCDFCHNALCKGCIRRNLGRKELHSILDAEEGIKWKCYVCDPKPLLNLIDHCSSVIKALAKQEKKQIEQENKRKRNDGKGRGAAASSDSSSISSQPVSVIRAPSVSVMGKTSLLRPLSERSDGLRQMQAAQRMNLHLRNSNFLPTKEQLSYASRSVAQKLHFPKNDTIFTSVAAGSSRVVPAATVSTGARLPASVAEDLSLLPTMERLLSATHSMNMFLTSLKDDLRRTCGTNVYFAQSQLQKRREVATKLWRAYVAYGKSFQDATARTNENVRKYNALAKIILQETIAKKRKMEEVIEVSDSDEEDDDEKPAEVETEDIYVSTSSFPQRVTVISNVNSLNENTAQSSQAGNQFSNVKNPVPTKGSDRRKRKNPQQVISDIKRSCLDDEKELIIEEIEEKLEIETISLDDFDILKFERIHNESCIDDVEFDAQECAIIPETTTMQKEMNGRTSVEETECNGKNVTTYSDCEEEEDEEKTQNKIRNSDIETSDVSCHVTSETSLVSVPCKSIISM